MIALGVIRGDERISNSLASLTGEAFLQTGTTNLPAITSHGARVSLVYRTHTTASAAADLSQHWHIDAVDKATVTFDTSDLPISVAWLTGTGDQFTLSDIDLPSPQPISGYEAWISSTSVFSKFRIYCENLTEAEWILERYWPDGQVLRYELIPSTSNQFRPSAYFDPQDNMATYAWTTNGQIQSITAPGACRSSSTGRRMPVRSSCGTPIHPRTSQAVVGASN